MCLANYGASEALNLCIRYVEKSTKCSEQKCDVFLENKISRNLLSCEKVISVPISFYSYWYRYLPYRYWPILTLKTEYFDGMPVFGNSDVCITMLFSLTLSTYLTVPEYCMYRSVADLWHFGTDPEPRIRTSDKPCYFRQWLSKLQLKIMVFLLSTFWSYVYIIF